MRLIDADALIEDCQKYLKTLNPDKDTREYARIKWLIGVLNNVPTIEPERWIPCSERLPFAEYGESDKVLATCGYLNVEDTSVRWIRELYFNGGNWCYPTGETYDQKVYAWMPLPEAYKGGE